MSITLKINIYPDRPERLPDFERDLDLDGDRERDGERDLLGRLPRELLDRTEPASDALSDKLLASESDILGVLSTKKDKLLD